MEGKRILVVDDEPGALEIVRTNLEWEGYQVLEVARRGHTDLAGTPAIMLAVADDDARLACTHRRRAGS